MSGGEHYFHTPEQLAFLKNWIREQNGDGSISKEGKR